MENVILGKDLTLTQLALYFMLSPQIFFSLCHLQGQYFSDCKRHSFYYFDFGNVVSLFNICELIFIWAITFLC
jgi:hypothetical protein